MIDFYLALIHHPVVNKRGEVVTTSVTNLDIHDLARTARTFGFREYFLVTPLTKQRELIGQILGHWETDKGSAYNPDRSDALGLVRLSDSIEETIDKIAQRHSQRPIIVATSAQFQGEGLKRPEDLVELAREQGQPVLLCLGTGWGLAPVVLDLADCFLEPIPSNASDKYNHLPVRAAGAIYLSQIAKACQNPMSESITGSSENTCV